VKPDYIEFSSPSGTCYIRKDRADQLAETDVAVFDCDGVLLDARKSYSGAVAESTSILIEALAGVRIDASVFDDETFFAFKKAGGFNNDWSVTYAYVMGSLATLDNKDLSALARIAAKADVGPPAERLRRFVELRKPSSLKVAGIKENLIKLAEDAGAGGVDSVDALLLSRVGASVKKFLRYPSTVGDSIVGTLFEEIFGGARLFMETFGFQAQFTDQQTGYVDKERRILTDMTVRRLQKILGGARFGIASGSPMNSARYTLGGALDFFPRKAQVWHEDVNAASDDVSLHKPNGYSLIRAASAYAPYQRVVYVRDTMADLLTARNADKEKPRFSFLGVYAAAAPPEETKYTFLSRGADAIAPTVNELPSIIEKVRRETR